MVDEEASPPTKHCRCTCCAFATYHAPALAAHKRCKHNTHAEASWWDCRCRAESNEEKDLPALAQSVEEAEEEDLFRVSVSQMPTKFKAKMPSLAEVLHMPPTPVTQMPIKFEAKMHSLAAALHIATKDKTALTKMLLLAQMATTNMQML